MMQSVKELVGFVLFCLLGGALSGWVTASSVREWYPALTKPPWTPPAWVFGPAWTLLYIMMGVAAWLVWRERVETRVTVALVWFSVQLLLNFAWSPLFFGLRRPDLALADILLLWAAILVTIITFFKHSPLSAALLVPYFLWVSFASCLNFAIWQLNR